MLGMAHRGDHISARSMMYVNGVLPAFTKQQHWLSTEMYGDRTMSLLVSVAHLGHETDGDDYDECYSVVQMMMAGFVFADVIGGCVLLVLMIVFVTLLFYYKSGSFSRQRKSPPIYRCSYIRALNSESV